MSYKPTNTEPGEAEKTTKHCCQEMMFVYLVCHCNLCRVCSRSAGHGRVWISQLGHIFQRWWRCYRQTRGKTLWSPSRERNIYTFAWFIFWLSKQTGVVVWSTLCGRKFSPACWYKTARGAFSMLHVSATNSHIGFDKQSWARMNKQVKCCMLFLFWSALTSSVQL